MADLSSMPASVIDNRTAHQFEFVTESQTAVLTYERTHQSLVLLHTEVPPALRGRHIADALAEAAIDAAHAEGLQIVAVCPFVQAYLHKRSQQGASSQKP